MVTRLRGNGVKNLACVPSSSAIQSRLTHILEEAQRLEIMLKLAKDLEAVGTDKSSSSKGKSSEV